MAVYARDGVQRPEEAIPDLVMEGPMENRWSRYKGDRSYLKEHPHMAPHLNCKMCGSLYEEDEPPDETLKGYCSEACRRRGEDEKVR